MILKTGNVFNIAKSKYSRRNLISLLYKMLLIISGALIPVFAFLQSFEISVYYVPLVMSALFGTILFSLIIGSKRPKYILLIVITMLFGVIAFYFKSDLKDGIISIANIILRNYGRYFGEQVTLFKVKNIDEAKCNTMFVGAVIFELTFILVAGSWYRVRAWLHGIITGIFLGVILMLGLMPNAVISMLLMAYLFAVVIAGGLNRRSRKLIKGKNILAINDGINAKAGMIVITMIVVVNFALMGVVSPVSYNRDDAINKLNKTVDKKIEEIKKLNWLKGDLFSNGKASGGIADGRLGQTDTLKYTGESAMKVTVPKNSNGFYLRGFVGGKYDSDKWERITDDGERYYKSKLSLSGNWISYTYDLLRSEAAVNEEFEKAYGKKLKSKMIIELTGAAKEYFYSPYFANLSNNITDLDLRVTDKIEGSTEIVFTDYIVDKDYYFYDYLISADLIDNVVSEHQFVYEYFVNEYYCNGWEKQVSDDIVDEFKAETGRAGFSKYNGTNLKICINQVKDYLADNMEYTLSPGKLKEGQDFLDEFIFVNKKGYCSYFASAATIMFRAQGIPARYVEGYIITDEDYKKNVVKSEKISQVINLQGEEEPVDYVQLNIKDYRAHAWTEIYVSGFGWIPIEVTTGYTNMLEGEHPTTSPQEQTTTKTQEQTTTKKKEEHTTTKPSSGKQTLEAKKDYSVVIKVVAIMLAVVAIGFLISYIIKMRFKKTIDKLNHKNYRKAINSAYEYTEKVNKLMGVKFANTDLLEDKAKLMSDKFGGEINQYETVLKIYDKLKYSSEDTAFSEEERKFVINVLNDNVTMANEKLVLRKKLQIKYIYGLKEKNSL